MRRFLRKFALLFVLMFTLLTVTGQVEATDGLRGLRACVVEEDEVILEDFYFACNTLVIYGYIDGDIAGIASEVTLAQQGHVTGDVWVLGGHLTVAGVVGDDVHFVGADLDITGLARFPNPRSDTVAFSTSMELAEGTVIPGDVNFYGYQAILEGNINGSLDFQGQSLFILNSIAGNVDAIVGDPASRAPISSLPFVYSVNFRRPGLYFASGERGVQGYINGNLNYTAPQRISTTGNVGGEVNYTQSVQSANIAEVEQSATFLQIVGNYILVTARDVVALSLVGILTLNFLRIFMLEPAYRVQKRPISAFSWGLTLTLLSFPTALLLILASLLITLIVFVIALSALEITVMVSVLLVVVNLGFIGGFFFLWAFVGRAIACFVIGFFALRWLQRAWLRYWGDPPSVTSELWFAVLIGVTIVSMLVHLPLGSLINILQLALTGVVCSAGLGALFMYLRDVWYRNGRRFFILGGNGTHPIPLPIPEDIDPTELPLGMANLPPGFTGFDD